MTPHHHGRHERDGNETHDPVTDQGTHDPLANAEEAAAIVAPNQYGIAAVIPAEDGEEDGEEEVPEYDTAGNELSPEERDAIGDYKPYD